ncbi:hypothetical protein ACIBIZ_11450 [Nonomuraea spiralis]|uniref:hypothetical protein n=1 Tax=Nonomuraea spiralis TaxID=46182 RepID=UPI0037A25687
MLLVVGHVRADLPLVGGEGGGVVAAGLGQPPGEGVPMIAPPGAGVAAAMQTSNQLDAFVVDRDGRLCVSWVVGAGNWNGPYGLPS